MQVAIIQNKIHKGGRLTVISQIIKVLNELGVKPYLISSDMQIDKSDIINKYGQKIYFKEKIIDMKIKLPYRFHILYFNYLFSKKTAQDFDLIINSSNSSLFLVSKNKIIHYIHYPQKSRILSNKKSINFPDGPNKSFFSINGFFDFFLRFLYKMEFNKIDNDYLIANSKFTKDAIINNYSNIDIDQVHIIYPPIDLPDEMPPIDRKDFSLVVSIGRFSNIKRQLEQIKLASQLPEFTFNLIGFKKENSSYFTKCKNYIEHNNIKNVNLFPNISFSKMNELLLKSGFFLHSTRNEPFGITSVQTISKGCIPIVHNSGGQKEIVNIDILRYENINDAKNIFKDLKNKNINYYSDLLNQLFENTREFNRNVFSSDFSKLVKRLMKDNK